MSKLFLNLLNRAPGINSQPGGIDSSESIPGLLKGLQIRAQPISAHPREILSVTYICRQCAKPYTFAAGPHIQSSFTGGGLTVNALPSTLVYGTPYCRRCHGLYLTDVQLLTVGTAHDLCSFPSCLPFPWPVFQPGWARGRSGSILQPFSPMCHPPPHMYKLCKEPSKAQIKKKLSQFFPSTTLFNLSDTLSYFLKHFLDPIILAFWQFTHIQDLEH